MPKRLLDSSLLISHFRRISKLAEKGREDARVWAKRLIENKGTNAIVSPVVIEMLAGVRDSHELSLTEAFLDEFDVVDERRIPPQDWVLAGIIAKRVLKYDRQVPRRSRRRDREQNPRTQARDLGDCLIAAIALRLNYTVLSDDRGIPLQAGRTSGKLPGS
jgi:predicted nucleic acid-binding protein